MVMVHGCGEWQPTGGLTARGDVRAAHMSFPKDRRYVEASSLLQGQGRIVEAKVAKKILLASLA